ncbi:MAG: alpha/beta hydrolase family protein [Gammaproteobacteria bacterium]|nr:alpha/beta hydrolase family protein [Gammaproteobacteria bacterium]
MRFIIIILMWFILVVQSAQASDLAREKRLAEQIEELIFDGTVVYLNSGGHKFMNVYMEAETEPVKGVAIILHGRGFHPDWEKVVKPLRIGLTEKGWSTFSMQMPVLDKEAKYFDYVAIMPEAFPRIEVGIDYLKKEGYKKIVLIAHSCSVHMVMAWVDAKRFRDIDAFVGVGMGATDYQQPMAKPMPLDQLSVPVLDIYGAEEYPAVMHGAKVRMDYIQRAGNKKSKQVVVMGADHYFSEKDDELLEEVSEWMQGL